MTYLILWISTGLLGAVFHLARIEDEDYRPTDKRRAEAVETLRAHLSGRNRALVFILFMLQFGLTGPYWIVAAVLREMGWMK